MDTLTTEDWLALSSVWTEQAQYPASDPDGAMTTLLERLGAMVSAASGVGILYHRLGEVPEGDVLEGWRPLHVCVTGHLAEPIRAIAREWMAGSPSELADGLTTPFIQNTGIVRCHRQRELYPDEEAYRQSRGYQFDRAVGFVDHLAGGRPIAVNMEMALVFLSTAQRFTERDKQVVYMALKGLAPTCERYAQSLGLMPGQQRLSPRERETLSYLLQGMSEKEAAYEMNLRPNTVHQYVVSLYRKLNVSSRAELMSLWLG